ncbi:DUF1796 family putative cysteine peptidase [Paenibacillus sacheonensis]|uniref:Peptidase n=1 Tax=Paenibacillus sacheonensis TaxID=742054 RepID=A0A7X4YMZ2_9BACL|nr:DUF1796 family putative cysteine peptidase [Paenibacillus sacheonensis]MBM7563077.1 hypothetical protein [Paenibacillus sacheonensis]NBC68354.1 peptidase [Paenibacillus sacheonensis]
MKLAALKGEYDAIYSLGHLCLAAIQMEKNDLRQFAGPLDWVASYNLPQVTRLLANRFAGFLEYGNLKFVGYANDKIMMVQDTDYDIVSNHDFYTHNNFPPHYAAYPEIKAKYDRRIARFLEKAASSSSMLFIRTEATQQEALELKKVLSGLVAKDFRLLVINHVDVPGMVELNWDIDKVVAVQFPNVEIWEGNNHLWTGIFSGVTMSDSD